MAQKLSNLFAIALTVATGVVGHGHVNNIVVNGVYYQGYDPTSFPYMPDPPIVVGWTAADTDNGFVSPDAYQTPDIVCHKNGTNAKGHASVKAGDSVLFQWVPVPWPHKSTVVDYLANCNGPCETVDKTTLEFFKIDGIGLLSGGNPGTWGSDVLIGNNNTWVIQIPEDLQTGNYVLRHELIALHSAEQADGAQNYPQCFNLAVTGTGSLQPSGVLATDLYHETDPGILFNIYTSPPYVYYAWSYRRIRPSFKCRPGKLRRDGHQQRHRFRRWRWQQHRRVDQQDYNSREIDDVGHLKSQLFNCCYHAAPRRRNSDLVRPVRRQRLLWPYQMRLASRLHDPESLLCAVP
ncbi:uncharacterized protein TrAtP1_005241 [Trichoderma atroviride]|uniref:uncharacterized protein n=1 Tax=Hypocrea atroviridis TaxID=63577 RepID=UPI00331DEC50|nr:hypothetical protein TrAtP1_005241 [Trichoderma atroviride]